MRVLEWQTLLRNESKGILRSTVIGNPAATKDGTIDRSPLVADLSKSIAVGTRKMVIYA